MAIITRYGFAPFAWYRIVAGAAALVWLAAALIYLGVQLG